MPRKLAGRALPRKTLVGAEGESPGRVFSDDAWREASWDEVLDLIAGRIAAAGREATALWSGHGNLANNYGLSIGGQLLTRFANLYGCQYWSPAMICREAWPRTQRNPRLSGLSLSPLTPSSSPSRTSTSMPQSVGIVRIGPAMASCSSLMR